MARRSFIRCQSQQGTPGERGGSPEEEKFQELATKKKQAVLEETSEPEPGTAANDFKIDSKAAAKIFVKRIQLEMATREIEQKVKLELENERAQGQLNAFEASEVEETNAPSKLSMKLNVISGQTIGMVSQGSKIESIISLAGHQVIRNLSEPLEFTLMHLEIYADYLRQAEPRTESRAVLALLTMGGTRIKKLQGHYVEVYGPYQVMLYMDGISIYTKTYFSTDIDQIGQIYLGQKEVKTRRIGHEAMVEQDAVHIGYQADVTPHLLHSDGKKYRSTRCSRHSSGGQCNANKNMGKNWLHQGGPDTNETKVYRGAIYVAGRTPIKVHHMGGRNLWISFLVVENLDNSDQFILGRDFVRDFDVMIDLNNGLISIRKPDRKYVRRPVNRIITNEKKYQLFTTEK